MSRIHHNITYASLHHAYITTSHTHIMISHIYHDITHTSQCHLHITTSHIHLSCFLPTHQEVMKCQGEGAILAFSSFFQLNSLRLLQISKNLSWEFCLPGSGFVVFLIQAVDADVVGCVGGFGEAVVLVKVMFGFLLVLAVVE